MSIRDMHHVVPNSARDGLYVKRDCVQRSSYNAETKAGAE